MSKKKELTELLKTRKLKVTSTRMDVLRTISDNEHAIAYSQIQDTLKDFDRVTLYRTLKTLVEKGIIHKALVDEQETFYALCSSNCSSQKHNHQHIHFKCKRCNQVSCVEAAQSIELSIPNHLISNFEIEATGICTSCM